MTVTEDHSIGTADRFGVIVSSGIWSIEYDVAQAQRDGYALFDVPALDRDELYRTDVLDFGDDVAIEVARAAVDELGHTYGFVVPDHLLGAFIEHFPDKEVYRQR